MLFAGHPPQPRGHPPPDREPEFDYHPLLREVISVSELDTVGRELLVLRGVGFVLSQDTTGEGNVPRGTAWKRREASCLFLYLFLR